MLEETEILVGLAITGLHMLCSVLSTMIDNTKHPRLGRVVDVFALVVGRATQGSEKKK